MVGGRIIENLLFHDGARQRRRLWCVDKFDECAVVVGDTPEAASLQCGERVWWQSGVVYARNDTVKLRKVGFSYNPVMETSS